MTKFLRWRRVDLIAMFLGIGAVLFIVENTHAKPPDKFSVSTNAFSLHFEVGADGRLYQRAVGSDDVNAALTRTDESYPQAGDGYVWEPALRVIHADGNTSTALQFENITRASDESGRELVRIQLRDPEYLLEVVLCFRTDHDRDVIEPITPGTKILDSKLGVRADQFQNPSFVLSLDGPRWKTAAACWPVHWNGPAVFNVRSMTIRKAYARCAA